MDPFGKVGQAIGGASNAAAGAAQDFLAQRVKALMKPETVEQMGYMKAHPVLGVINMGSKMLGGPGLTEGFQDGVIRRDGRDGTADVIIPPLPY